MADQIDDIHGPGGSVIYKASRTGQATDLTSLARIISGYTPGLSQFEGTTKNPAEFNPGPPPTVMPVDGSKPNEPPRQWVYRPGRNLPAPPWAEKEVDPDLLIKLADLYDILRMAIEIRKSDIYSQEWDIVPRVRNTRRAQEIAKAEAAAIQKMRDFVLYPEAYVEEYAPGKFRRMPLLSYLEWANALLEDHFVLDALTVYPRFKLNGEPLTWERVDGKTIKPLLRADGRIPLPPAPAYNQYINGVPTAQYTVKELLYRPRNRRNRSPYGFSPVESSVIHITEAVNFQTWNVAYYSEGSIPEIFFTAPPDWTAAQIEEFNEFMNQTLKGNLKALREFNMVPGGVEKIDLKPYSYSSELAHDLIIRTCALMGIQPIDLGLVMKGSGSGNNAAHQASAYRRKSLIPTALWFSEIVNTLLRMSFPEESQILEFRMVKLMAENSADIIAANKERLFSGQATLDQILLENGDDPVGINKPFIVTNKQVFFFEDLKIATEKGSAALQALAIQEAAPPSVQARQAPKNTALPNPKGRPLADLNAAHAPEEPGALLPKPGPSVGSEHVAPKLKTAELEAWERKAIRDVQRGQTPRPFLSETLDPGLHAYVTEKLATATTRHQVREVFKQVTAMLERGTATRTRDQEDDARKRLLALIAAVLARLEESAPLGHPSHAGAHLTYADVQAIQATLTALYEAVWLQAQKDHGADVGAIPLYVRLQLQEMAQRWARDILETYDTQTLPAALKRLEAQLQAGTLAPEEARSMLSAVLTQHWAWKIPQIVETEANRGYNQGVKDWVRHTHQQDLLFEVTPDRCVCDVCQHIVNNNPYTWEDAQDLPLPAHPGCVHYLQIKPKER